MSPPDGFTLSPHSSVNSVEAAGPSQLPKSRGSIRQSPTTGECLRHLSSVSRALLNRTARWSASTTRTAMCITPATAALAAPAFRQGATDAGCSARGKARQGQSRLAALLVVGDAPDRQIRWVPPSLVAEVSFTAWLGEPGAAPRLPRPAAMQGSIRGGDGHAWSGSPASYRPARRQRPFGSRHAEPLKGRSALISIEEGRMVRLD